MNVLMVHGYSESSLSAYYDFPARLQKAVPAVGHIALAAFDSLEDTVTIDDLAEALETRFEALLRQGWTPETTAVICHSTGALIARRWILNRAGAGNGVPSHLITMAGANHGSSLAQMGKSVLGYIQKAFTKHILSVGANVLTDLDYGSDFLWRLNRDWLAAWNDGTLAGLFAFSMGGDSVGDDPGLQVFWQTHETGSDNTVRISGANLNYTMIDVKHTSTGPAAVALRPARAVPHIVLHGYSHFGQASGIIGYVNPNGDAPLGAVAAALNVSTAAEYSALAAAWSAELDTWMAAARVSSPPGSGHSLINATAVFSIQDESGRPIADCVIAFLNKALLGPAANATGTIGSNAFVASANAVSSSILPHSPIQNDVERGSYSFYIDYDTYTNTSPHWFHIEAALPGQLIDFVPLTFTQPPELAHAVAPNEFTYLSLSMKRDTDKAFAVYAYGPTLDTAAIWLPFPDAGLIT